MGADPATLGTCSDGESKWQPVGAQEDAQPPEPLWPGRWQLYFKKQREARLNSGALASAHPGEFSFSWYHSYNVMVLADSWLSFFKIRVLDPALPLTLCVTLKLFEP